MNILPDEVRKQLPPLYSTERDKDPICWVKLYNPLSSYVFYVIEFDGDDLMFGYADGVYFPELGYTALSELENVYMGGYIVERDRSFKPCRLSAVRG